MVREGRFREDLYYRINETQLILLPLFLRPGDLVPLLINSIKKFNEQADHLIEHVGGWAIFELFTYRWPGNVCELENVVQKICALSTDGHLYYLGLNDEILDQGTVGSSIWARPDEVASLTKREYSLSELASAVPDFMAEIDALIPEERQEDRGYWKLGARLARYATELSASTGTEVLPATGLLAKLGSLESEAGHGVTPMQEVGRQPESLQSAPREDPYSPIYDLTRKELLEKYERGILARYSSVGEASKAADVDRKTIYGWRKKYG